MKTMLIPVDFTPTSDNAVMFAAEWSKKFEYTRIILLKTFYDSMFENIVISAEYARVNQDYSTSERENAGEQMDKLKGRLIDKIAEGVEVVTTFSELPLMRAILDEIDDEKPELVVVGSDNFNYSSGSFIAGNLIAIARVSPVRVLIVPADYHYQPIKTALVPFDFNLVYTLEKLSGLRKVAYFDDVKLMVLNVDPKQKYLQPDEKFIETERSLHAYLENFQHELHYDSDKNVLNAIMKFIGEHKVDLIIALPGRRSFLYSLTHKSISQALYLNGKQPVLILK